MNLPKPPFKTIFTAQEIEQKIAAFAEKLNQTYAGSTLVLIGVLKGAFCFLADLMRHLTFDVEIAFIRASSYGAGGVERGELFIEEVDAIDIKDRDVLVIDDIFDSGVTLETLMTTLTMQGPKSIKCAVLLAKKGTQTTSFRPHHTLFELDDHFVIGYGLDHKEKYRNLPGIYIWEEGQ